MNELGSLLGRWHQWRRHWSHERGYARQQFMAPTGGIHDDDDFEQMLMEAIEREVSGLPREFQLVIQHAARAECLGVEVITVNALRNKEAREALLSLSIDVLRKRLVAAGVL